MRLRLVISTSFLSLALLQASAARADGVLPASATPVQREQAQARFVRGKEAMARRQYDEALTEFRASREIVASPNARLELARCLLAMGKVIAAYAEFGRTAIEAKELTAQDNRYQRAYDAARAERAEIEPNLGFVTLTIDKPSEGTRVTVGGEEIRPAAWNEPSPVQAGTSQIVVETPGRLPIERSVTVAAGERAALVIDAQSGAAPTAEPAPAAPEPARPPPPAETNWMRPAAFAAGGIGVAGLATFVIFGLMARSTYDDLNGACPGSCPPGKADEIASGKTQQTIANVGLAFGVAGAAAGATLFVLSTSRRSTPSTAILVAPGFVGLRGSL